MNGLKGKLLKVKNDKIIYRLLSEIQPEQTSHNIGLKQVLLANGETDSVITQIAMSSLKRGEQIDLHFHKSMAEHFYFYSGKAVMRIGELEIKCKKGVYICVPPKFFHSLKALKDIQFLTIGISV